MLNKMKNLDANVLRQTTLLAVLLMQFILFSILSDNFLTSSNMINVLRQVSITAISSVGMFMIILLGDIDLSIGAKFAFIGVFAAYVFRATESTFLTMIVAILLGCIIGFIKGFITAKGKIPSFVTTLAIMSICRGIANVVTGGTPIGVADPRFTIFGTGYVSFIPLPVIVMLSVIVVGFFITNKTRFGRHIYACGGNEQASKWSGLNTDRIRIAVFVIAGFTNGLSALIFAGRLGGGLPAAAAGMELDIITAVILGGTRLTGGKGRLWGVIIGVIVIGVLNNGLTMLNVSSFWQQVVKGFIILVAVLIDRWMEKE